MTDAIVWPPEWPRYLDDRLGAPQPGEYRQTPDDFLVEEDLGFAPEGQGEHLWLWIAKRDATTSRVASSLAHLCGVTRRDVGYAGMKDRVAVTRQWFSVHLPGKEAPADLEARLAAEGYQVEARARHPRKLKRGVHRGNRFRLKVTGPVVQDTQLAARFDAVIKDGVPNYFGPQRFGPEGRNLSRAVAVLARGWRKRDDRDGMLLSAARSYLFNAQLAERLRRGEWRQVLSGDVMMLEGSRSLFEVGASEALAATSADSAPAGSHAASADSGSGEGPSDDDLSLRLAQGDIHPTAVLWGRGGSRARADAGAWEKDVLGAAPALCQGLEKAGVQASRRALRVMLGEASLVREGEAVWLSFRLPAGAFATAVLRELMTHPSLQFRTASEATAGGRNIADEQGDTP
ncbi:MULTISPECIES: tRNA pseudouridine(13) synthase TruD [Halomonas]|uniref:tRNA pseudouridine(13) synthase TruD n=1 Tax=Halomonas TaxID=2745 RepID=UPI001C94DD99|nr:MULTISPECIES: tRNA pseudouridine(13) synthase TruD [Halomonas]MBY6207733.1 tRNA pseudouridine(13) synthase TruD [Halomonas sp. DP3Y7-2]MBY6228542.1 tRNA pseudouridine(13) synthase TruD [Halomonas sp. DP3Y7-1]MCA0916608.1 tRNA pseudouridine(13) synthase TruD [Halomonas denitrificans]